MTHTASHIIIHALKTPLSGKPDGKAKLWHACLLLLIIAYCVGYASGS
jgi:hypothetical protein